MLVTDSEKKKVGLGLFTQAYFCFICSIKSYLLVQFHVRPLLSKKPAFNVCGYLRVCLLEGFYYAGRKKVVSS